MRARISSIDPASWTPPAGEDHEVVAHALELGDDVRGGARVSPLFGDGLHQPLQELPSGERVERCDRLVEHEQLRPLGERERQRDLRLLAAGQPSDLLPEREPEPREPLAVARSSSQRGLSLRPSLSISATREAAVERMLLRDEADAGQDELRLLAAPTSRARVPRPRSARVSPIAVCSSVVLPAPFGPTSAVTEPAGIVSEQSRSAQSEP